MKNLFYTVVLSLLLFSCGDKPSDGKQQQLDSLLKEQASINEKIKALKEELKTASGDNTGSKLVAVQQLAKTSFRHYVEVQARVDGDESVSVSPRTPGTVSSILVKEGDKVSKGQVLAILDDQIMQQSLAEVQTQYDFAKNIYEKQKNLWDQKIGSEVQFLTAKNNKESLERRLASVSEQLDMTRIKSPVNGTVDNLNLKVGQSVMPGVMVAGIVNLTGLKVEGEVGESYAGKIKKGDDVILVFPDLGKEINTKVGFASRSINTLNRTFNVEVPLPANIDGVSPNMVVIMKIVDYVAAGALVLPVDVLQRSGEGYYAMVAVEEGGKLVSKRRIVTMGKTYNGQAEITDGIENNDQVIITGYRDLNDGQELRIK